MKHISRIVILLIVTALITGMALMSGAAAFGEEAKAGSAVAKAGDAKAGDADAKVGGE
jgi:hypothetical protein